ncbi:hypothetical protein Holit_01950 [Hollandina sp. SP2]
MKYKTSCYPDAEESIPKTPIAPCTVDFWRNGDPAKTIYALCLKTDPSPQAHAKHKRIPSPYIGFHIIILILEGITKPQG